MGESSSLPPFLHAFEDFHQHVEAHFDGLNSSERGQAFLQFALKAMKFSDDVGGFSSFRENAKKSHDHGVDFFGHGHGHGPILAGQSKYKLGKADEFDSVISKFQSYESQRKPKGQTTIAVISPPDPEPDPPIYCVCTISKLTNIIAAYRKRSLASKAFFEELERTKRIIIVDGPKLFAALHRAYLQSFVAPKSIELALSADAIEHGSVFLTVLAASELSSKYDEYGPSLFFENIREFLGFAEDRSDRANVNHEIRATLLHDPQKMLAWIST